ncbi:MAG: Fic family protein [Deltaproteobacteria bacterium]|nr:Fic family protein [Deltaproteobacteria bacterium]
MSQHISEYIEKIGEEVLLDYSNYPFLSQQDYDFGYSIAASAVFSSNIEGNTVDLNSYMNWRMAKKPSKPTKEIEEIENLIRAYEFCRQHPLTEDSLLKAHRLLSQTLLIKSKRGRYRQERTGVFSEKGLVYLAVEPEHLEGEMTLFFKEITGLLHQKMNPAEILYYAAFIHLQFVHIHPFADGNGRMARLLEKWFLIAHLGDKLWTLPSEKYYRERQQEYYRNLNLGVNFYELDYGRALPFLYMLPRTLKR